MTGDGSGTMGDHGIKVSFQLVKHFYLYVCAHSGTIHRSVNFKIENRKLEISYKEYIVEHTRSTVPSIPGIHRRLSDVSFI